MLSPRDLINLSRVDEKFCLTLTAKNVSFVWREVREAEGGVEPPRGIPEYQWVDLLFGIPACDVSPCSIWYPRAHITPVYQFCDGKKAHIEWKLRRRVCNPCLKEKYVHLLPPVSVLELIVNVSLVCASRVRRHFPDINNDILSLIPLTDGKTAAYL